MNKITSNITPNYPDLHTVKLNDKRFAPWLDKIFQVTVPDVLNKFEADGALENYDRVASHECGGHNGPPWFHGLICETIRGISDMLVNKYDANIDARLDAIIARMVKAQDADSENYINPYTTLECPEKRWGRNGGNIRWQHEIYNAGALAEAGVHHYLATGKTDLLAVAVKMCNYLARFIGDPPKKNVVAEHSLPEEAFTKLYKVFENRGELAGKLGAQPDEYFRLAKYFIDHKGDNETRYTFPPFLQEYAQDHRPAREQREAVGHAVRATLFYTGMAAVALESGDAELAQACRVIWNDVIQTKLHANGCVGTVRNEEKFGQQYELPNDAYLETCAGVGFLFWGMNLFRLFPEAAIWDCIENTLYNLIPASISETCDHYTYENPLESRGGYTRWSWHKCPCCPPMFLKATGCIPSIVFAQNDNNIWLNLYISSQLERSDCKISFSDGTIKILPESANSVYLNLRLRIPDWVRNYSLYLNGEPVVYQTENGYAVFSREFNASDVLEVKYDMPVVKYEAHPYVAADRGRVIIKHGPVLYCAENIDNGGSAVWEDLDFEISEKMPLALNADESITGTKENGEPFTLIPYYKWNNRGANLMRVWLKQEKLISNPMDITSWDGKLYRPVAEY